MKQSQEQEELIFDNARKIADRAKREAYLKEACGDDARLYQRLCKLLEANLIDDSFLERTTTQQLSTPIQESAGAIIGPYKLLQQIGEGGMGIVYMAEQTEPVKRKVALKIIKPGMDTRKVVARFEAERQALALMEHPNIAKVFDGGSTDGGRPYFVMELVKGTPITKYCDDNRLTTGQRLDLFITVCQAVQHAHQKGIIHRDLKPTNIMVAQYDERPVVKVIDFGVAKATSQQLTEKTMFTEYGQIIGTIEYMSPEQARVNQLDIDTRSDVYSLGVLLYELLTGETPFDKKRLRSAAFEEMLQIIREEEPPKPSTRLSSSEALPSTAVNRSVEPAKLNATVRGDLDWIVMRALEKDRNRRYESANSFAADIKRYLKDEPVEACPPSRGYRLQKFTKRNKTVLITTMIVAISLLFGAGVSVWQVIKANNAAQSELTQRVQASNSLKIASDAIETMLTEVAQSPIAEAPEFANARTELFQQAKLLYDDLIELTPDDSMLYVQRGLTHGRLNEYEAELADLNTAVTLDPNNHLAHHELGSFLGGVQNVFYRDYPQSEFHAKRSTSLAPEISRYWANLGYVRGRLANSSDLPVATRNQWDIESEVAFDHALEINLDEANTYIKRCIINRLQNRLTEAIIDGEKALELDPERRFVYHNLAAAYAKNMEYEKALQTYQLGQIQNPYNVYAFEERGNLLVNMGRYDEAFIDYSRAIEINPNRSYSSKKRGWLYFRRGEYEACLADIEQSLKVNPKDLSSLNWNGLKAIANCPDEGFRKGLIALADHAVEMNNGSASSRSVRASVLIALGKHGLTRQDLDFIALSKDARYDPLYQAALLALGNNDQNQYIELCLNMLTTFAESDELYATHFTSWTCALAPNALEDYDPAIQLARHAVEKEPTNRQYLNGLGAILMRAGQYDAAKIELEKSLAADESSKTSSSYTRYFLAMTEHHLGHKQAAQDQLQTANNAATKELEDADSPPVWNRMLTLELLRKEAEDLIK